MSASVIIPSCAAVVGVLYSMHAMRVKAREIYGLYLIASPSFGLLFLGAAFALLSYGSFYGLEINHYTLLAIHPAQGLAYLLAAITCGYMGLTWNVRRSNPPFGLAFSIVQLIAATTLILIVFWLVSRRRRLAVLPQ